MPKTNCKNVWGVTVFEGEEDGVNRSYDILPDHFLDLFPHDMKPFLITSCASDALSNVQHMADIHLNYPRRSKHSKCKSCSSATSRQPVVKRHPVILSFANGYGAARGAFADRARISCVRSCQLEGDQERDINQSHILSTVCYHLNYASDWEKLYARKQKDGHQYNKQSFQSLTDTVRVRLDANERAALDEIEERCCSTSTSTEVVAGVLIECISSDGQAGYSPAFLYYLRKLCDRLKVWLIFDETMTALRCGSFFMYELMPHFTPDYVIFGKAVGVSGVAVTQDYARCLAQGLIDRSGFVSVQLYEADIQRCKRRLQKYDPKRVFQAGLRLVKSIGSRLPACKHCYVRGLGCLIALGPGVKLHHCDYSFHRLLPRLDVSDAEINQITSSRRCTKCSNS